MDILRPKVFVYRSVRGSDLITMRSLWMQMPSIPTVRWSFRRPPEETNSGLYTASSFQAPRHLACNDTVLGAPHDSRRSALEKKLGSEKGRDGTGQRSAVGACHRAGVGKWMGKMEAAMKSPTSSHRVPNSLPSCCNSASRSFFSFHHRDALPACPPINQPSVNCQGCTRLDYPHQLR